LANFISVGYFQAAFWRNRHETDPEKIKALIAKGDFIIKELETLYYLRKYRTLRQRRLRVDPQLQLPHSACGYFLSSGFVAERIGRQMHRNERSAAYPNNNRNEDRYMQANSFFYD
uniref:Complex1_LYR_dom domain-containing protein n=1 Tax=Toxocara canis TaxID=6265 RepID=A0A183VEV9_TOXCA